ncbi:HEAT repeat domain-containing protein [Synechococcus sp. RSCCF101]|uniref:HEAT repeat domain-containing protein n=1 Tax=Synechococcus sp. RSCCF101 TaxID=2511069 RepID=UPI001243E861|nr:HEAT repeat domain-containing protein [Synechococcus sp. RSCCF101]QEY32139.1 HEAT repeat domain-containing protein [Synechococcus sp. RSCCF101]
MTVTPARVQAAIAAVNEASSAQALLMASRALAAMGDPAAIPTLITILGFNNPGAAVAAVDGLVAIGEPAVLPLLGNLDARNYGARAWAIRALAGLRDVRGLEVLVDSLLTDVGPSVRRAAACGLGGLQLQAAGTTGESKALTQCVAALCQGADDGEWVVRYASVVGLERRLSQPPFGADAQRSALAVLRRCSDPELEEVAVVRERARRALQRLDAATTPSLLPPA